MLPQELDTLYTILRMCSALQTARAFPVYTSIHSRQDMLQVRRLRAGQSSRHRKQQSTAVMLSSPCSYCEQLQHLKVEESGVTNEEFVSQLHHPGNTQASGNLQTEVQLLTAVHTGYG